MDLFKEIGIGFIFKLDVVPMLVRYKGELGRFTGLNQL